MRTGTLEGLIVFLKLPMAEKERIQYKIEHELAQKSQERKLFSKKLERYE